MGTRTVERGGGRAASPAPTKPATNGDSKAVQRPAGVRATAVSECGTATAAGEVKAVAAAPAAVLTKSTEACRPEAYTIGMWIALLCVTQLAMFIFAKLAMQQAKLPSLLCLVQFTTSALGAALPSPLTGAGWRSLKIMGREHVKLLVPLGVLWTMSFLSLNASVSMMSAALANVVRAMEPAFVVFLGFFVFGDRYSFRLVATLLPISAGVALASLKDGAAGAAFSMLGVVLAALSNVGFASRPFLAQTLAARSTVKLDSTSVFFNAMCIGVALMSLSTAALEGRSVLEAVDRLRSSGDLAHFATRLALSSVGFFIYQFSQMVLMTKMSPVAFSVVTPMSKAFVIVACALYFGEGMSLLNIAGVSISTFGILLFTLVRRADNAAAAKAKAS